MLSNETVRKLQEMHLSVMAEAFSAQLKDAQFQIVPFEDRLAMLVDAEWCARKSNRLTRLIRKAGYADPNACVENIEYLPARKLDREQILRLASCTYLSVILLKFRNEQRQSNEHCHSFDCLCILFHLQFETPVSLFQHHILYFISKRHSEEHRNIHYRLIALFPERLYIETLVAILFSKPLILMTFTNLFDNNFLSL